LPYFIGGYYIHKLSTNKQIINFSKKPFIEYPVRIALIILAYFMIQIICGDATISANTLYGSYPYSSVNFYNKALKLKLMLIAWIWIGVIFYSLKFNHKIHIITRIGSNTMPIFLFHGFIVRYMRHIHYFTKNNYTWPVILLITIIIVYSFGNIIFEYVFNYIFKGKILDKVILIYKRRKLHNSKVQSSNDNLNNDLLEDDDSTIKEVLLINE